MHAAGPKNPLHGITLEKMVTQLQAHYGWDELADMIRINCFAFNPSIKSSLSFLRKTPWARQKVEDLYLFALPNFQTDTPAAEVGPESVPAATVEGGSVGSQVERDEGVME